MELYEHDVLVERTGYQVMGRIMPFGRRAGGSVVDMVFRVRVPARYEGQGRWTVPEDTPRVTTLPRFDPLESTLVDADLRLIHMLALGDDDRRIARAFGVTRRTVERRVARLARLFGTRSRLHLGVRLATTGWTARAAAHVQRRDADATPLGHLAPPTAGG